MTEAPAFEHADLGATPGQLQRASDADHAAADDGHIGFSEVRFHALQDTPGPRRVGVFLSPAMTVPRSYETEYGFSNFHPY